MNTTNTENVKIASECCKSKFSIHKQFWNEAMNDKNRSNKKNIEYQKYQKKFHMHLLNVTYICRHFTLTMYTITPICWMKQYTVAQNREIRWSFSIQRILLGWPHSFECSIYIRLKHNILFSLALRFYTWNEIRKSLLNQFTWYMNIQTCYSFSLFFFWIFFVVTVKVNDSMRNSKNHWNSNSLVEI